LTGGILNEKDQKLGCMVGDVAALLHAISLMTLFFLHLLQGADKTKMKYLIVGTSPNPSQPDNPYVQRKCVERCENEEHWTFINRCIPKKQKEVTSANLLSRTGFVNFFQDISEDLSSCWQQMIYVCLISFAFSFVVLVLFRYVVGLVVWLVLIASVVAGLVATIFLWIKYAKNVRDPDSERVTTYLVASIVATCVTILIGLVIFVMRKRVKLVIQLFTEAGKAIADMPMLLFEPLLVSKECE
jgi:solute carrier family 44 protein 1 (choline transporter-like protein)